MAELVSAAHGGAVDAEASVEDFMRVGPWADIERILASGRNDGVMRLAAALRGWGGWRLDDAMAFLDAKVWPLIDPDQAGQEFKRDEIGACVRSVWERYAGGAVARLPGWTRPATTRPSGCPRSTPWARWTPGSSTGSPVRSPGGSAGRPGWGGWAGTAVAGPGAQGVGDRGHPPLRGVAARPGRHRRADADLTSASPRWVRRPI
ncbi:MAG TPA: hypothetical protein VGM75_36670 [Pseudonocardiaceae bacterium]